MRGVPRFNVGAFFMPGIWGPAHGLWVSILFYPLWLLADNVFFAAFSQRTVLACVLAGAVFVFMTGLTLAFSLLGQPYERLKFYFDHARARSLAHDEIELEVFHAGIQDFLHHSGIIIFIVIFFVVLIYLYNFI